MLKKAKTLSLTFTEGMNKGKEELNLGKDEAREIYNMMVAAGGALETRNGFTEINSSSVGNYSGLGLFYVDFDASDRGVVAAFSSGKIYKMENIDGTCDELKTGLSTTAQWSACKFENNSEKMLILANGVDAPQKITDGTPWAIGDLGGSPPNFKYPVLFYNRIAYVDPLYPTQIRFTDVGTAETHTGTNIIDVGVVINGLGVVNNRLLAFSDNSINAVDYIGDVTGVLPFRHQQASSGVGCISHYSIVNTHNALLFFDGYTIQATNNGVTFEDIGQKLKDFFLEDCDFSASNKAVAVYYPKRKQYLLSVRSSSGTYQDLIAVADLNSKTNYVYSGINTSAMCIIRDNTGDDFWLTLTSPAAAGSGTLYKQDDGTDDDGTAIDSYVITAPLHLGTLREKILKYINIHTVAETGTTYIDVQYRTSLGDSWSSVRSVDISQGGPALGTFVLNTDTLATDPSDLNKKQRFNQVRGDILQYKLRNNTLNKQIKIRKLDTIVQLGRLL